MIELVQGTDEWRAARAGKITASRLCDVMAKIKTGEAATRRAYRWELLTERLTGLPCESYTNRAMEWGTAHEPEAREAYEAETGNLVEQVGFLLHPDYPMVGCSPDGMIGKDGGLEIKCPHSSVVHVQTLKGGMPSEHKPQVQGTLWITGRTWWDFVSFDPRMPEGLRLYVERIQRDEAYIAELAAEVLRVDAEVTRDLAGLQELRKAA
jgi:putative phage-type endonuclease